MVTRALTTADALAHLRATAPPDSDVGRFVRALPDRAFPVDDPAPALDALQAVASLRRRLDQASDDAALGARRAGASWAAIGRALGVTKQAAFDRWGRISAFAGWDADSND